MRNPVLLREINTMFRSYKAFIAMGIYGLAVFGITILMLVGNVYSNYNSFNPKNIINTFCIVVTLQTLVLFLVVPGISSGAISGERERQTLDLMLLTKMTPFTIVFGKLLSSLLFISIMVFIAMPVYGIFFYYGSISLFDLLVAFLFDFSYAMVLGAMSILFSAIFKKTVTATVLSYVVLIFYPSISAIIMSIIFGLFNYNHSINEIPYLLSCFLVSTNPIAAFTSLMSSFVGSYSIEQAFSYGLTNSNFMFVKVWYISIILNVALSFILLKLSAYIINPIKKKF